MTKDAGAIEGLWTVERSTPGGTGPYRGVVVFETDRVLGGDEQFYYVGKYDVENGGVTAEVTACCYVEGASSMFDTGSEFSPGDKFEVELKGKRDGDTMSFQGHVADTPGNQILLNCRRVEDLP